MKISVEEYFDKLGELLNLEKEEERRQFKELLEAAGVQQRVKTGYAWYPLRIVETGYGMGDYPFVVVERTKSKELPHSFGAGKLVGVFSEERDAPAMAKGVIQYVKGDQIKLLFFADELPEVFDYGQLSLNLLFDENAYADIEQALAQLKKARNCAAAVIRDVLTGIRKAEVLRPEELPELPARLNEWQQEAVNMILHTADVSIVHGPPGTGKTTTLIEAARLLTEEGEQVMMAAPSNAAADWLAIKAAEAGLRTLRIGNPARIDEKIQDLTVEGYLRNHEYFKDIKAIRRRADELRQMAGKYKRNFGAAERQQRKLLMQEARLASAEARNLEQHVLEQAIEEADVVTCTLAGAAHSMLNKREFGTVFIDEAAQAPEPACWLPVLKARRLVLAGDPFQLPPTVKSVEAARRGLAETLIGKALKLDIPMTLLRVQYRMNEQIMAFPNSWFYEGKLESGGGVGIRTLGEEVAFEFIDTGGLGWEEEENAETRSLFNRGEADLLWKRLEALDLSLPEDSPKVSVGVISPYKEQVLLLEQLGEGREFEHLLVEVQTIDSFQGQERDAIYVSLVRSNTRNEIGFLADYRRMNVAMTRARKKLVMIGDSSTLANDKFYSVLIEHAENTGAWRSGWEFAV